MNDRLRLALEALYGSERRKDKLGLDGTRALLAALGHPERAFRSIHVGGTNGKGSVCALIERVLRDAGHRTGLYTSPHLVDFRERIRVGGRWADEARLEARLAYIQSLPEGHDRTFFEVATALAFDYFKEQGVEWAVVEVGMGGRLDSTNVLEPAVAVLTTIGLDHTEILGETIEKVAFEKAGIIKRGVPVVAPTADPDALRVIEDVARERGAPVIAIDGTVLAEADPDNPRVRRLFIDGRPWRRWLEDPVPRVGVRELGNVEKALTVLKYLAGEGVAISTTAVEQGFLRARWPGRFEPCPLEPRLFWDGAHNPHGALALQRAWRRVEYPVPCAIVLALSRDKDLDGMLDPLARLAGGGPLWATATRSERAMPPERIAEGAARHGFAARVSESVASACREALATARPDDRVLLTGSLFAVGEAMEAFGGAPGEWL